MSGPPPKRSSERRRRNMPASHGAAEPTTLRVDTGGQPALGFAAHPMVEDLWASLGVSVEGGCCSPADWQRARLELFYVNALLNKNDAPRSGEWATAQAGLTALLISPAEKRRVGIELRRSGPDEDEEAAVRLFDEYRKRLRPDPPA